MTASQRLSGQQDMKPLDASGPPPLTVTDHVPPVPLSSLINTHSLTNALPQTSNAPPALPVTHCSTSFTNNAHAPAGLPIAHFNTNDLPSSYSDSDSDGSSVYSDVSMASRWSFDMEDDCSDPPHGAYLPPALSTSTHVMPPIPRGYSFLDDLNDPSDIDLLEYSDGVGSVQYTHYLQPVVQQLTNLSDPSGVANLTRTTRSDPPTSFVRSDPRTSFVRNVPTPSPPPAIVSPSIRPDMSAASTMPVPILASATISLQLPLIRFHVLPMQSNFPSHNRPTNWRPKEVELQTSRRPPPSNRRLPRNRPNSLPLEGLAVPRFLRLASLLQIVSEDVNSFARGRRKD